MATLVFEDFIQGQLEDMVDSGYLTRSQGKYLRRNMEKMNALMELFTANVEVSLEEELNYLHGLFTEILKDYTNWMERYDVMPINYQYVRIGESTLKDMITNLNQAKGQINPAFHLICDDDTLELGISFEFSSKDESEDLADMYYGMDEATDAYTVAGYLLEELFGKDIDGAHFVSSTLTHEDPLIEIMIFKG